MKNVKMNAADQANIRNILAANNEVEKMLKCYVDRSTFWMYSFIYLPLNQKPYAAQLLHMINQSE
jgi:hypothetical protein